METSGWITVRCVVELPDDGPDGATLFEERLTLWHTDDFDEAIELAQRENEAYAASVGGAATDLYQAYLLADDVAEGAELFSLLRPSKEPAERYITRFFDEDSDFQDVID